MKFLYLDIDGVLAIGYKKPKETQWGYVEKWDKKCVEILNEIIKKTGAKIVVSSDWKINFTMEELIQIFKWQGVEDAPHDCTPDLGRRVLQTLEQDRAKEILLHIDGFKGQVESWIAVDDLDLSEWLDKEHFIQTPRWMEGIKQSSKKEKIIAILNKCQE